MVITEEQAFMVITAMAVKENEIQLCSDEYMFLIELAKFIDPERKAYARAEHIKQWEKQAKLEKAAEEAWAWEIEDKEEREAEVYWESFYNH